MPTGYTCDVQSGKITKFNDFAMRCVRAMGVCVTMRDDSSDAKIPERFDANTKYHDEHIESAKVRLSKLQGMSQADAEQEALAEHELAVKNETASRKRRSEERKRYEAMLSQVDKWNPPTDDHKGFKDFMTSQLKESIDFDCGDYSQWDHKLLSAKEWLVDAIKKAERDIAYHTKEREEEIERANSRTAWMQAFRKSL